MLFGCLSRTAGQCDQPLEELCGLGALILVGMRMFSCPGRYELTDCPARTVLCITTRSFFNLVLLSRKMIYQVHSSCQ